MARVAAAGQDHANGSLGAPGHRSGTDITRGTGQHQVDQVALQPGQDHLGLRVAETGVELDNHGALAGQHHLGVEAPVVGGTPYHGCLYTQVMLTSEGPMVIEFNARFGDPEAQVVLPRLQGDLVDLMLACAAGDVSPAPMTWSPEATVGVVLASRGYPGHYETGIPIDGLDDLEDGVLAFHAGTRHTATGYITRGGRVVTIVASGKTVAAARERAYAKVARVTFDG